MSKATLIALATPNPEEQEAYAYYTEKAPQLLVSGGGQLVRRLKVASSIKGDAPMQAMLIMDFPSTEAIKAVFDSQEYAELVPHRDKAFSELILLITEEF